MSKLSVLQNAHVVDSKPFPHICIENALPRKIYKELAESFPESLVTGTTPHDGGVTYRYKSNPALIDRKIPNIWQEFFEYHTSQEYFDSCVNLFEPYLERDYPGLLDQLYDGKATVRDVDNTGRYVTDCQFVVHEPVAESTTTRTPHVDNPVEIYAGLLYMKQPNDLSTGGDFTLHETNSPIMEVNKTLGRQVADNIHVPVKKVTYQANTFCMFLNVPNSVHSVSPRHGATVRRRSINIIGEFNNSGRMWKVKEIKNK